jgi:poly-beta-1,6-N-acetyl-D-glucosamine N-deacetylase
MKRRLARIAVNGGLRGGALVLVLCGVAAPAFAYWTATRPPVYGLAAQQMVPLPPAPAGATLPSFRHGVLILCYHDLSDQSHNEYTVRPQAFAAQMVALHAAGAHTITARQFERFVTGHGAKLPSRPVLITFDDGAKGTWIYADPVLRRLHLHAVSFLITGDVSHHQPYYLDWAEVAAMHASGRWDFGSHTSNGHGRILIDSTGTTDPFLTNREWLPAKNRLETLAEYRSRVVHDLDQSITDIVSHGLPRPEMFAFPFSAFRTPTNDPAVPPLLAGLLDARFEVLMDNVNNPTLITAGQASPLPRVEVYRTTTTAQLLKQMTAAVRAG